MKFQKVSVPESISHTYRSQQIKNEKQILDQTHFTRQSHFQSISINQ